ncbi:hypothetical protein [Methanofollis sp. UBA420]|uniref:hypothetical protein n=1 Tax=Methanofollis sp. UBA420 TaxID=1915514 RepID=UPI00316ACE69
MVEILFMLRVSERFCCTDSFACRLRCHAANGEVFSVAFTRTSVRVSAYEDDALLAAVETWADGMPALN